MVVVSPSSEIATTTKAPSMEPSPSRLSYSSDTSGSGAAFYKSSVSSAISSAATPEHDDPSNSSPSSFRGIDIQEDDKAKLVEETGLQLKQINNWFINQRKRNWHSNSQSVTSLKSKRKR